MKDDKLRKITRIRSWAGDSLDRKPLRPILRERAATWRREMQFINRCQRRCKGFLVRVLVLGVAVMAVFIVMMNTGEVITVAVASERIADLLGAAAADTLAE